MLQDRISFTKVKYAFAIFLEKHAPIHVKHPSKFLNFEDTLHATDVWR